MHANHLEADTHVTFHVNRTYKNGNGNISVRGNDTNIAIVLTCNAKLLTNVHFSYDFGVDCNNSREYLDVTKLPKCLIFVQVLPSIYQFPGNDYFLWFYRKGKTVSITVMNKHEKFVNSFIPFGPVMHLPCSILVKSWLFSSLTSL